MNNEKDNPFIKEEKKMVNPFEKNIDPIKEEKKENKKVQKGERSFSNGIDWKNKLMFWKKDKAKSILKKESTDKENADKIITFTLFSTIALAFSFLLTGIVLTPILAVTGWRNIAFTQFESSFALIGVIALFLAPLFLAWFLWDLFITTKNKSFKKYTKNELKRIYVAAGFMIAIFTIIFGILMNVISNMFDWRLNELSGYASFGSIASLILVVVNFLIIIFIALGIVWLVKYSKLTKKAIFAGSFDPIHEGHINVIEKSLKLFDQIIVVVANNSMKESSPLNERAKEVSLALKKFNNVKVAKLEAGLIADFASERDINILIRSARENTDFEYELKMAESNRTRNESLETVLIMPDEKYKNISSSSKRDEKLGDNPFLKKEEIINGEKESADELFSKEDKSKDDKTKIENEWFNK